MRVALVLHGWPASDMGGTGLYVDALARALARTGHEVAIVYPINGPPQEQELGPRLTAYGITQKRPTRWRETWTGTPKAWQRWLRTWEPDVVHFHHLSGFYLGMISDTSCRTVLTLHDYAIPCARGQLVTADLKACDGPSPASCTRCLAPALQAGPLAGLGAKLFARSRTASALAHRVTSLWSRAVHPDVEARLEAAKQAIETADVVLSPSKDLAQRLERLRLGRVSHTDLPLVSDVFPAEEPPDGPVRFLFASAIIPTKGPDRLLRAFRQLKNDSSLTIAGATPDFPSHPRFADQLRTEASADPRVSWRGAVPTDHMNELLAEHDVLVLPSRWPENSPLIVREATRAGLFVIASASGGTRELAPDGTYISSDDELLEALQNAAERGRGRAPSRTWPTPQEHAEALLLTAYSPNGHKAS